MNAFAYRIEPRVTIYPTIPAPKAPGQFAGWGPRLGS
jgi:hypothetical protein